MAVDPLYQALGTPPEGSGPPRRARLGLIGVAVLLGLAAAGGALALRHDGHGGETGVAVARIETAPVAPPVAPAPPPPPPPAAPAGNGDTVEIQHGVKIIRLGTATSSASIRIPVPDATPVKLAHAPDPRLVETTRAGTLPRIGPDGARPAAVYARPTDTAAGGPPRIALVAGGMGLDQLQTAQAGQRLPPDVTFAFTPDGADLPAQVAEARAAGHEVVLQLPEALAVAAADDTGLGALHKAMSAFVGYAGVTLPPPGTGTPAASRDILQRGLYAIEGAASGAAAPDAAGRPADVVIAATDDAAATTAALARLAAIARAKGSALGLIVRADANIAAIAAFTDGVGAQGLRIVPASGLADTGPGTAAATK